MPKRGLFKKFEENNCRFCPDIFCCKRCREKHEISKHNITERNCEICVYGTIKVSSISENIVNHIKSVHWPLHCVSCNRIFSSVEELFQNRKCPIVKYSPCMLEKTPFSPVSIRIFYESNDYDSPPHNMPVLENHQKSTVATSTPMQKNEENNIQLKQIQEVITPVDSIENTKHSILKKDNQEGNQSDFPKRRVTFSTPVTDTEQNTSENEENTDPKEIGSGSQTNLTTYYSAQDLVQYYPGIMDKVSIDVSSSQMYKTTPQLPGIKTTETTTEEGKVEVLLEENKTLWISALNTPISQDIPGSLVNEMKAFVTPIATNTRKRQVNLVMPSVTVIEKITKCTGAIQISSTPNSSIIPIQSVPRAKDIFKTEPLEIKSESDLKLESTDNENSHEQMHGSSSKGTKNIWTSVSRLMKNFASSLQNISTIESISTQNNDSSLKRYPSDQDLLENPPAKRYKLTEIKCRPSIRGLPRPREQTSSEFCINFVSKTVSKTNIVTTNVITDTNVKTYADKSTQTDDYLYNPGNFFMNLFK